MPALMRTVAAGQTLRGVPDIGLLLLDHARRPAGLCARRRQAWSIGASTGRGPRLEPDAATRTAWERAPAVSLALAKRAGANAVVVSQDILRARRTVARPR